MPEFLQLTESDRADILASASQALGRRAELLEKDVWVCWALESVFGIPDAKRLAFKGGTSLSKGYSAISRFSEDVDITIDWRSFGVGIDPLDPATSRSQIKKLSKILREQVDEYSRKIMLPHLEKCAEAKFGAGEVKFEVIDDGEVIFISYPTAVTGYGYVPEKVKLELGGRNKTEPSETLSLVADLAGFADGLEFPEPEVRVLSPKRTFWEKTTLIHDEALRPELPDRVKSMSRHWSDLALLADHEIGARALEDLELLADVARVKQAFYVRQWSDYESCCNGGLNLTLRDEYMALIESDYEEMCEAQMFWEEPLRFGEICDRLKTLEEEINSLSVKS